MGAAASGFESHGVSRHDKTPAFTAVTVDVSLCSCLTQSNVLQPLLNRHFNKPRCQGRSKSSSWGVVQTWRYCVHCCFVILEGFFRALVSMHVFSLLQQLAGALRQPLIPNKASKQCVTWRGL